MGEGDHKVICRWRQLVFAEWGNWGCGNGGACAFWLLQEIEPGLPRWEFDVTTAMHFLMAPQQSRTGLGHNLLSRCCTRHFSLSHRAPIHSRIRSLGGQGRHFWQMVRQLPMKTGWWDASLALRDLAMSNLHDIFRWLETEHWPEMG